MKKKKKKKMRRKEGQLRDDDDSDERRLFQWRPKLVSGRKLWIDFSLSLSLSLGACVRGYDSVREIRPDHTCLALFCLLNAFFYRLFFFFLFFISFCYKSQEISGLPFLLDLPRLSNVFTGLDIYLSFSQDPKYTSKQKQLAYTLVSNQDPNQTSSGSGH